MRLGLYSVTMCVCRAESMRSIHLNFPDVSHNQSSSREAAPAGPRNVDCTWMFHQFLNIYDNLHLWKFVFNPNLMPTSLEIELKSWSVDESHPKLHSMGIPTPKLPRGARCKSWDHLLSIGVKPFPTARRVVHWHRNVAMSKGHKTHNSWRVSTWGLRTTRNTFFSTLKPKNRWHQLHIYRLHLQRHGLPC